MADAEGAVFEPGTMAAQQLFRQDLPCNNWEVFLYDNTTNSCQRQQEHIKHPIQDFSDQPLGGALWFLQRLRPIDFADLHELCRWHVDGPHGLQPFCQMAPGSMDIQMRRGGLFSHSGDLLRIARVWIMDQAKVAAHKYACLSVLQKVLRRSFPRSASLGASQAKWRPWCFKRANAWSLNVYLLPRQAAW